MKSRALVNEVRKRVSELESKYETIAKDLEIARGFLAMVERESENGVRTPESRTHTDIVGDTVMEILSHHPVMHRKRILGDVLERGVHIGFDQNPQKQLAGLSSILSRDPRFKPAEGKNGYWRLATPSVPELSESNSDSDDTSKVSRPVSTHAAPIPIPISAMNAASNYPTP